MNGGTVAVTAPAKINLSLGVGPVRPDGFHALATVYQAVGLFDQVTVSDADDVTVTVRAEARLDVSGVPTDGSNIVVRAARLLAEQKGLERGVAITIDKGIPVAGGMAGGSADGAAALLACDHLWGLGTAREELLELAAELGSDVPFAMVGGTAIGTGRGELVSPLMTRGEFWWVILESDRGLSTPQVYAEFDEMHLGAVVDDPEIPDELFQALRTHDLEALGKALTNDLQAPALRLRPELARALDHGRAESAFGAVVSGSGPSCLFLCESRAHATQVAAGLAERGFGHVSFAPGPVHGARVVAADA
ncbi:MAG: 4-(cytidine 5'-diphospho)-2-C-methyl-D-erythritol kinase [Nocardioidaceae bacterium]|nr:4-(cytidine 5'-diphospho)-2-C-methyl-D-erythritol kinase [Nocardioidaceae bacterium]NUS51411.1 4-(cytidine 5'-diphospho)-2-C-methyl-D-erythritol kinase [Nocardioidaceae bacterium]